MGILLALLGSSLRCVITAKQDSDAFNLIYADQEIIGVMREDFMLVLNRLGILDACEKTHYSL